ncbi:o-succinylbenzoate synthase [Mesorhizobium japonicum]|uniref:o-succinylbenzoate synthase n=1 Tax=Mesorhizobium TaxID=68287 RepID=UPI0008014A63|nr:MULTISPECIES: o-succinylbenzoate synthase [Mesorhizobium]MUT24790.1 o-succinylbenzoate synthase [Mesorhizobium japonicum]OBQ95792.1 o-succinylbenzoate synthase [Mesorhizobium sp. AA23]
MISNPPPLREPLVVESADLRLIELPLLNPFTISSGTVVTRVAPIVVLRGGGCEGYAEGVADVLPDYLPETIVSSMMMMRDVLLPALIGKKFANPQEIERLFRPWRDHQMAKAAVEMAFWDLWAKAQGLPLWQVLGGTRSKIEVGVSLGIKEIPRTLLEVAHYVQQRYRRIKLKVNAGHDLKLLDAVRAEFPDIHLTVDANCCYTMADLPLLRNMDDYRLDYIEQPLAWNDLHDHARLQSILRTSICLDESIRTLADCRKALQSDAGRVINIKVGRLGGHTVAKQVHDLCLAYDVPVWCGGMMETGIGRAHNIHLSTLEQYSRPGDTSSSSRYFERDIVVERLETCDGLMPIPVNGAGIGVTMDWDFLDAISSSVETIKA